MPISPAPGLPQAADLLRRAQRGDRAALGALLGQSRPRMRAITLRICQNPADAEDAVQEASLSVVRNLGRYRGEAPFSTWLHRVTVNAALLLLRRRRRRAALLRGPRSGEGPPTAAPRPAPASHEAADPADPGAWPDELCQQRWQLRAVAAAARGLSPRLWQALELRELQGLEGPEVARRLGVSLSVVKTRIHRARGLLQEAVRSHEA